MTSNAANAVNALLADLADEMTAEQKARAAALLAAIAAAEGSAQFQSHDSVDTASAEFGTLKGLVEAACLREDDTGRPMSDDVWSRFGPKAAANFAKRGIELPAEFFA